MNRKIRYFLYKVFNDQISAQFPVRAFAEAKDRIIITH